MLNVLKWPTPPFSSVLKLVVRLFLLKSVRFARYMRFGVFVFDGHFDVIRVFFRYLEMTYPPIFKCSKSNDVKKFFYTITIWKIWGGLTFGVLWLTFPVCHNILRFGQCNFCCCLRIPKPRKCISNFIKFCQIYVIMWSFRV